MKEAAIQQKLTEHTHSITFWIVSMITVCFLIWAPFERGLFNGFWTDWDRPIFSSYIWTSIVMILAAFFFFTFWKYQHQRDTATLLIWLLPLCYLLSLTQAASHYFATSLLYLHIMYAAFFVIVSYFAQHRLGNRLLETTLITTGYVIVLYGLLNWLGNASTPGMVSFLNHLTDPLSRNDAVMVDSNGYRLASVLQYANTYAGLLIALLLGAVFLAIRSTGNKTYVAAIHGFMLVPIFLSFFLTLSRGAIVVLPVVLLILLFFLPLYRQILMIIYVGIAAIATMAILSKVTTLGEQLQKQFHGADSREGWLLVLITSLVTAVLVWAVQHWLSPWLDRKLSVFNTKRYTPVALPVIVVVLGTIGAFLLFSDTGLTKILPDNVRTRIENINFQQHSVLERGTFYKDSLKLFKDYPVLGAGGGAWAALYEKYQNNPYTSRQAHNFLLQYLDEIGIIGFAALILVLFYIFYAYIRHYLKQTTEQRETHFFYAILATTLLLHSVLDFDMSYGYIALLTFIALGGMAAATTTHPAWLKARLTQASSSRWDRGYGVAIGVIGVIFFIIAAQLLRGNTLFSQAQAEAQSGNGSAASILKKVNGAISAQAHPAYYQLKIAVLDSIYGQSKQEADYQEALKTVNSFVKKEPNQRAALLAQYQHAEMKQEHSTALNIAQDMLKHYPWDITVYEMIISLHTQQGDVARTSKNQAEMDRNWNTALDYYNQVLSRMKELESLPKEQIAGREFDITNGIAVSLGQIYYMRGDYQAAATMLRNKLTDDFSETPDNPQLKLQRMAQARWYLATLRKLNQDDPNLLGKLITKDANEMNQINAIVNTNFSLI
jgi:O-antigen ligase